MSRIRSTELQIEGYVAKINAREITVSSTGRSFDQRDERAYQRSLNVPADDAERVAGLFHDAAEAAKGMTQ